MKRVIAPSLIVVILSGALAQAQTIQKRPPRPGENTALRAVPQDARAQAGVVDRQDPTRVRPDGTLYPTNDPTPHYMRIYHGAPYGE